MANFGASFKQARESKGISLKQIAAETRINTRFLQAIENEEFNLLPGGIFNRGFVRAYAERLGLDPAQAITDYERLIAVREPTEILAPPAPPPAGKSRHLYPAAIGALVLLIATFYIVTRESPNVAQTANAPPPALTTSESPASIVPGPPGATGIVRPEPVASPSTPEAHPAESTISAANEPEPAPPKEALRIDMEVHEKTWIRVAADGNALNPGELLAPGMTRHFAAQKSVALTVGNAAGVVLKINDMPGKELGASGEVRELHITPNNIKDFIR